MSFVSLLTIVLVVIKLATAQGKTTFVTQFRSQPNVVDFVTGGLGFNGTIWDMASLGVAAVAFFLIGLVLAYRSFKLSKPLSLTILSLTIVLQLFLLAVSNILLGLR